MTDIDLERARAMQLRALAIKERLAPGTLAVAASLTNVGVIVRDEGLILAESDTILARIPKADDAYDLGTLSEAVVELKRQHPGHDAASVLLEPNIEYDHLIQVMDVVRSAELTLDGESEPQRVALFTDISIGDAP